MSRSGILLLVGEQGWCSGESARLPPMCPGFDSRTRRHMWVELVVGSLLCSERFFSGYSGFPLSSKTNTSKFQFDLETVDEEPPRGNATANPLLLSLLLLLPMGLTLALNTEHCLAWLQMESKTDPNSRKILE